MAEAVERGILRFFVKHRFRDLTLYGGWTEEQMLEAFEAYARQRPDAPYSRLAETFRADVQAWMRNRSDGVSSAPMVSYRTIETEP